MSAHNNQYNVTIENLLKLGDICDSFFDKKEENSCQVCSVIEMLIEEIS